MTLTRDSSLTEVAFAVCTALDRSGTTAVLTGGSAATFYAPEAYQSMDLDFVIELGGEDGSGRSAAAVLELGYTRRVDHYVHRESRYLLEFPRGPLMVGGARVKSWATHRRSGEVLYVLSPTDSCRDRLAWFLFDRDWSGLEQAVAVAVAQRDHVDLDLIREWCTEEGYPQSFGPFMSAVEQAG